jgi:hypothetical protein
MCQNKVHCFIKVETCVKRPCFLFQFTVYINNRKARTGEKVEVAIYGEPGAYVGLSGIDRAFYTMQAGNELTYAKVRARTIRTTSYILTLAYFIKWLWDQC